MTFFEEFTEKALHAKTNFALQKDETKSAVFVPINFNKATFIYGMQSQSGKFRIDSVRGLFWLVAVVYEDQIAVYNPVLAGMFDPPYAGPHSLSPNVTDWVSLKNQIRYKAKIEHFYPLFLDLEPCEITDEIETECRTLARRYLIQNEGFHYEESLPELMNEEHVLLYLSDALDLDEHCKRVFEENKEDLSYLKALKNRYEELVTTEMDKIAEGWELKLANGLQDHKRKVVTVTFTVNGLEAAGRMSARRLFQFLEHKQVIDSCDFAERRIGKKVYETLSLCPGQDYLHCSDISKVTFGRKVLYAREHDTHTEKEGN